MSSEQKERWDEANEMERQYPGNPLVISEAIRIRQSILKEITTELEEKDNV
jgi:hypothetical protein